MAQLITHRGGAVAQRPVRERFLEKASANAVRDDDMGCLIWTKGLRDEGYADTYISGVRSRRVHRVSYEIFIGTISEGREIDHLCGARSCIEPYHLREVPGAKNVLYKTDIGVIPESGFRNVHKRSWGWEGIITMDGDQYRTETFKTAREASVAVERLRRDTTGLAGFGENVETLRSLWRLMKFDPTLSLMPLYI